jgi:hypothetical protein
MHCQHLLSGLQVASSRVTFMSLTDSTSAPCSLMLHHVCHTLLCTFTSVNTLSSQYDTPYHWTCDIATGGTMQNLEHHSSLPVLSDAHQGKPRPGPTSEL